MNIIQKLTKISAEIGELKKSGWNDFNKYHFVEIEDIIQAVNKQLVKHNIRYFAEILEHHFDANFKNVALFGNAVFTDDKGEVFKTQIFVNASDKSDKAGRKAMQMFKKQAFLDTFLISIGDKDADAESPQLPTPSNPIKWNTVTDDLIERIAKKWDGTIVHDGDDWKGIKIADKYLKLSIEQFETLKRL